MSVSPKDLTSAVTELTEVGTVTTTGLPSTRSAKKSSISFEGAQIAILFLSFWGICASILVLLALYQ